MQTLPYCMHHTQVSARVHILVCGCAVLVVSAPQNKCKQFQFLYRHVYVTELVSCKLPELRRASVCPTGSRVRGGLLIRHCKIISLLLGCDASVCSLLVLSD